MRTVDVMALLFGEAQGVGWLWPLLCVAEVPSSAFRLQMLILQLLVLRAHLLPAFFHARHACVFRFVVNTITDVRFGAEKRFHYIFFVTQCSSSCRGWAPRSVQRWSYEAEKLFRQMQQLAPHKENYWQKAHTSLTRLFVTHSSGSQDLPFGPFWETLIRQVTATSAAATILQHSALRQLAVLLEFAGCDPFGRETMLTEAHWRAALLQRVSSKDTNTAAYSYGVVDPLMKRWKASVVHRSNAGQTITGKSCAPSSCFFNAHGLPCESWITPDIATHGGPIRRLFSRMLSWLPMAAAGTLKPLLCAFLALWSCDGTAQLGDGSRGNVEGKTRRFASRRSPKSCERTARRVPLLHDGRYVATYTIVERSCYTTRRIGFGTRRCGVGRGNFPAHDSPYWPGHTVFSFPSSLMGIGVPNIHERCHAADTTARRICVRERAHRVCFLGLARYRTTASEGNSSWVISDCRPPCRDTTVDDSRAAFGGRRQGRGDCER